MITFDWVTFVMSVSTSVLVALVIDWVKAASEKMFAKLRAEVGRRWRRECKN